MQLSIYIKRNHALQRIDFNVIKTNPDLTLIQILNDEVWIKTPKMFSFELTINEITSYIDSLIADIHSRYPVTLLNDVNEAICSVEYDVTRKSEHTEIQEINEIFTRVKPIIKLKKQKNVGRASLSGEPGHFFVSKYYAKQVLIDIEERLNIVGWTGEEKLRFVFEDALERLENKQQ